MYVKNECISRMSVCQEGAYVKNEYMSRRSISQEGAYVKTNNLRWICSRGPIEGLLSQRKNRC